MTPRQFTDDQLAILSSFAALVVDELELRRIAQRDQLTGALTRRGFIERMSKDIALFARHRRKSVLVLLDLDHFKAINDGFGHPAGDAVLKAVAETCRQQLRTSDAFGRLGGEEFGILLADTGAAGGLQAAEKIRRAIADLRIDIGRNSDRHIRVTASFGLAPLEPSLSRPDDWLSDADAALYAAKRAGRNRCVADGRLSDYAAA